MEPAYRLSQKQVEDLFQTNLKSGLSETESTLRLKKYGPNNLRETKLKSVFVILAEQFKNYLILILLLAGAGSFIIGNAVDAVMILLAVVLNCLIGFIQQYQVEKILADFRKLITVKCLVIRDGQTIEISSHQIVPGDLILLSEGQKVPADLRIISENYLRINESILTGESEPIEKNAYLCDGNLELADQKNIAFSGTTVTFGKGSGIAVATGMKTEIGKILHLIERVSYSETPLQQKINQLSRLIGWVVLIIALVVGSTQVIFGHHFLKAIISATTLAVAAIPEGLPAIVTITLALGAKRLTKNQALIKHLPAAETLGSTDVICVDKTGTLTEGKMTTQQLYYGHKIYHLNKLSADQIKNSSLLHFMKLTTLSSTARQNQAGLVGDPTDTAVLQTAAKLGVNTLSLQEEYQTASEILFSAKRKMMTVISKSDSEEIVCSKGALEAVLNCCNRIEEKGTVRKLTKKDQAEIFSANIQMAGAALRVIAVAYKESKPGDSDKEPEKNLVFLGLLGMIDPPRSGVKEAISVCHGAGIKVVMITGDHILTARAIAQKIGLADNALSGQELDNLSDSEFAKIAENITIFARVTPEHKIRIVNALKSLGHQVAMTGDGINDAPALKAADIGIAMGISGCDIAKDASDMILLDDHFQTIVTGIKEGRAIYENIKKFVNYLLTSNMGEVLTVFIAVILGWPLPLLPVQILWINLISDGLPSMALANDPPRSDIMTDQPKQFSENIVSRKLLKTIILVSILLSAANLSVFSIYKEDLIHAESMVFTGMVLYDLLRIIIIRFEYGLRLFSNKLLNWALFSSLALQLLILYLPFSIGGTHLYTLFHIQPLLIADWGILIGVGLILMVVMRITIKRV